MSTVAIAILTTVSSAAGIIGLIRDIYQKKEGPRSYALLVFSFSLAALSGVLWNEAVAVSMENQELKSARIEAGKLVQSWPKERNFTFISRGEARGIVLSGLAFLEANRAQFPETYEQAKTLFRNFGVEKNNDKEWYSEIGQLQQAAETMVVLISSVRLSGTESLTTQ